MIFKQDIRFEYVILQSVHNDCKCFGFRLTLVSSILTKNKLMIYKQDIRSEYVILHSVHNDCKCFGFHLTLVSSILTKNKLMIHSKILDQNMLSYSRAQ